MENFIFNDTEKSYNEFWKEEIVPQLKKTLGERNIMQMPKLELLSLHVRVSSNNSKDKAYLQSLERDLTMLSGQKCVIATAKKSVSNFKLREGNVTGAKVTLRRKKMKSFLAVLRDIVIPSLRDFRGLPKTFSKNGGYNMTIFNHDIFPGVNVNEIKNNHKVHISFVMKNVGNAEEALALLQAHDMPFVKKRG